MQLFRTFICLSFSLLLYNVNTSGQNSNATVKDTIRTAPVEINVVDGKQVPRIGEKVVFSGQKSKKVYSGRTDKAGKLSIALPAGDEYIVVLTTVADSTRFGTLPIPPLTGSQFYKNPFVIEIKYEPAKIFTLNNVHFDFGKATLSADSFKELEALYEYLEWKETSHIEIGGHADNVGDGNENMTLSQKRAEAVKDWLVKNGVHPARITAKGYGAEQPLADNTIEQGRQQNRRTEVKIL